MRLHSVKEFIRGRRQRIYFLDFKGTGLRGRGEFCVFKGVHR